MKILFILPRLSDGGVERVVSNISLTLGEQNIYHDILVWEDEIVYPHNANNIIRIGGIKRRSKIYDALSYYSRLRKIKKIKKKNNYDLVISGLIIPNLMNISSRKYSTNTILTEHTYLSEAVKAQGILGKISNKSMKKKFKYATKIVAVSKGIKQDLVDNYNVPSENIDVIYNSVRNFDHIEGAPEFNKEDYNIISVGRLSKAKGQWHLIYMMKELITVIPRVKLHILGFGPLDQELKSLVEKLELNDYVKFYGFKENVSSYIKSADLMLVSSIYEGFGNVLIEAMALGTPIITTDCEVGPREIVTGEVTPINFDNTDYVVAENAILIPNFTKNYDISNISNEDIENQKRLKTAIVDLYNDNDLAKKLINNGLDRSKEFNVDKINQEWLEFINSFSK